jgi:methyltransferase-like protein
MLRDMMRYHADKYQDPIQRTHHARALLYFLSRATPRPDHPYTRVLQHAVTSLNPYADSYIFHEYLEAINEPIYFHQFLEMARASKLQYIAEADVVTMGSSDFPPDVNQVLTQLSSDWFERQQFVDFVLGRQFRESLLCHANVTLDDGNRPERIPQFHIASATRSSTPNADVFSTMDETFPGPRVGSLTTSYPIVKAALRHLAECWPATVPFDALETAAHHRIYPNGSDPAQRKLDRDLLATTLLRGYLQIDLFELRIKPLPLVATVSDRPLAMPFARWQASQGPRVTNQRHEPLDLTELERYVIWKLDGERDHAALLRTFDEPAGQAVIARTTAEGDNAVKLANCLHRLAKAGLVVG